MRTKAQTPSKAKSIHAEYLQNSTKIVANIHQNTFGPQQLWSSCEKPPYVPESHQHMRTKAASHRKVVQLSHSELVFTRCMRTKAA
jgi:hypothetical protein